MNYQIFLIVWGSGFLITFLLSMRLAIKYHNKSELVAGVIAGIFSWVRKEEVVELDNIHRGLL
jgi:hypothetical protein